MVQDLVGMLMERFVEVRECEKMCMSSQGTHDTKLYFGPMIELSRLPKR
jgi:hypothetical protein